MGLPDEFQLKIIQEVLGPRPTIPLATFSDRADLVARSPLAPFLAHPKLFHIALDHCRDSIFSITFDELIHWDAESVPSVFLAGVRYLRVLDPDPFPSHLVAHPTSLLDLPNGYPHLMERRDALRRLQGRLPALERLETYVLPDIAHLPEHQLKSRFYGRVYADMMLKSYYRQMLLKMRQAREKWLPHLQEIRITVLNEMFRESFDARGQRDVKAHGEKIGIAGLNEMFRESFDARGQQDMQAHREKMERLRHDAESKDPVAFYPSPLMHWDDMLDESFAAIILRPCDGAVETLNIPVIVEDSDED